MAGRLRPATKFSIKDIMIKKSILSRVYFGWWTVIALGIVAMMGGLVSYGFSAFLKPIAADLGLSRAITSLGASIIGLGQCVGAIIAGRRSDKADPKKIILIGIACLVLGFIIMSFTGSLWILMVCGFLLGVGYAFCALTAVAKVLVNWFIKNNGAAISITFSIQSLAGLALLPLTAWLIETYGWHIAAVIVAVIIAVIAFPLCWFFVKSHGPEHHGLLPDGEIKKPESTETTPSTSKVVSISNNVETPELTAKETMKTLPFWLYIIATGWLAGLAAPIMTYHCIPFLTDTGVSPVKAAAIMSVWLTASIPARVIGGFFVDRMKTSHLRLVLGGSYFVQALGIAIFVLTKNISLLYLCFILYGIGWGSMLSANIPLIPRYFGRKIFGTIDGTKWLLNAPIVVIAPIYVGWAYDSTGSYSNVFTLFAILLLAAGIVVCFMFPPKIPKAMGENSAKSQPNKDLG